VISGVLSYSLLYGGECGSLHLIVRAEYKRGRDMSRDCVMCGKRSQSLVGRWYKYDNGEQFLEYVCAKCADLHAKLVNR
jgi:hypothetical protein